MFCAEQKRGVHPKKKEFALLPAVWDVARGYDLYKNAQEKGIGQVLKLWDEPYLA